MSVIVSSFQEAGKTPFRRTVVARRIGGRCGSPERGHRAVIRALESPGRRLNLTPTEKTIPLYQSSISGIFTPSLSDVVSTIATL